MYILCVYAIMAPAHESETIVFNFRKLLSTLPNYAELEQILLFSVNWGKQVCTCFPMVGGCPGTLASSTTKTGRHDIAEILLKVALNTKNKR